MKKITFFIHNIYKMGGTERVVGMIANELCKEYEVEIVSLHKESDNPFYNLDSRIRIIDILGKELQPIKLYYPYLMYKVKNALRNYKTDIFICAGIGDVGLTIFMRKKAKYITWEHFNALEGKIGGVMWLGRILSKKYADKIVVLTKKDEKLYCDKFKVNQEKMVQIYNPMMDYNVIDKEYKINSKKIITVGRFTRQKGFDMLVQVAEKVFEKHKDWEWHIYGDGEEFEKINKMIVDKNLQNNVKLMGRTDKIMELYNEYSMYVMTSRFEGFPMVNIEAQCAKLPIISFDCNCGPSEIVINNKNGYVVDCFDINQMAEKICYLIEHDGIRKQMSENTMLDKEKLQMGSVIKEWEKLL